MKTAATLKVFFLVLFSTLMNLKPVQAGNITMRHPSVPINEFNKFVSETGGKNFSTAVIEHAETLESRSEVVDKCLFAITDTPSTAEQICFEVTRILSKNIWSSGLREVLEPLFARLSQVRSKHQMMYSELNKSLTAAQASADFLVSGEQDMQLRKEAQSAISKRFEDAQLLVNGFPIRKAYFLRSHMIYQWMLITNWGQIVSKVGRWSEFKKELATIKIRSIANCQEAQMENVWSGGLESIQYYYSKDCHPLMVDSQLISANNKSPDLAHWPKGAPEIKSNSWGPWVPVIAILGLGLASSLQDKHVTVSAMKF